MHHAAGGAPVTVNWSTKVRTSKDKWSASPSSYFNHSAHWTGGFMNPAADLDRVKNSYPVGKRP
jgi:hypothetical protein